MNSTAEIRKANTPETGALFLEADVFVPAPASQLYEILLDVRSFPRWVPAVRRVEILEGPIGPGMVSEWEVLALGIRKRVRSVLEAAEDDEFLRWSHEGPVRGWGECRLRERGNGTLARFITGIHVAEPLLRRLACRPSVHSLANSQLKRSLAGLGKFVCGPDAGDRVLVGVPGGPESGVLPAKIKGGAGAPPSLTSKRCFYSK